MRRLIPGPWLLTLALSLVPVGSGRADDPPLSPAQIALFESDHLKDIKHPERLEYTFEHHGGLAGDYTDKVVADVRGIEENGRKDVWIDFLSGERRMDASPAIGFNGNPLLMYFLEHDVDEMRDATGGAAQYFRTRIRQAFAEGADVHPVEVKLDGKTSTGTEIVIAPFRNDAHAERFRGVAEKTYRFVLCGAVPGSIYQISTGVPSGAGSPAAFEETMTYAGEHDEAH